MKKYGLFKQKHLLSTKSGYINSAGHPVFSCYNMFFLVCIDILPRNFFLIALFFPSAESPLPIGGAARHFFPSVESVLHIDDILIGLCLSSHCSCHSFRCESMSRWRTATMSLYGRSSFPWSLMNRLPALSYSFSRSLCWMQQVCHSYLKLTLICVIWKVPFSSPRPRNLTWNLLLGCWSQTQQW